MNCLSLNIKENETALFIGFFCEYTYKQKKKETNFDFNCQIINQTFGMVTEDDVHVQEIV
jgi:hypothetical protein